MGKGFQITNAADDAVDVYIYDVIGEGFFGGVSSRAVVEALREVRGKTLNIFINSPGGSVFEGFAIHNELKAHKGRKIVTVRSLAASAASVIAMAGDEIFMESGSFMMIHNASGRTEGDSRIHSKMSDILSRISGEIAAVYSRRTKRRKATMQALMDNETWFTAEEAVEAKFADKVIEASADKDAQASFEGIPIAACAAGWRHAPQAVRQMCATAEGNGGREYAAEQERDLRIAAELGFSAGHPPADNDESEDEDMELKDLTVESLKASRPDLFAALAQDIEAKAAEATKTAIENAVKTERDRCQAIYTEGSTLTAGMEATAAKPIIDAMGKSLADGAAKAEALADLRQAKLTALTAQATPGAGPNGDPEAGGAPKGEQAKAAWNAAVKAKTDGGMTQAAAVAAVVKEQPELQKAYLAACQPVRTPRS